jgi:hypothetical protein
MNSAFDARIRELEADVRKAQGDYENWLLTILLAANGTAMLVAFSSFPPLFLVRAAIDGFGIFALVAGRKSRWKRM